MKSHFIKNSIEENITVHNKIIYLQKELNLASSKILNTLIKKKKFLYVEMEVQLQTRSI